MLYSNLLKRGTTIVSDEKKCVIDTNELIAQKLEHYKKEQSERERDGFRMGLNAPELEVADLLTKDAEEDTKAPVRTESAYEGPTPEELLAQAKEQIAVMEQEAKASLEEERLQVLEKARREGYDKGFQDGQKKGMAQADELKQSLREEQSRRQQEYQDMVAQLEPQFIDTLTGIYEHLFHVELSGYRDIVVYLITSAMSRIEGERNFLIHVSKDDFAYVNMQKKEILSNSMVGNATVEIVEDISLHKNECLIETEGGIFDCGLGTQLAELSRKLKLLSYEKE